MEFLDSLESRKKKETFLDVLIIKFQNYIMHHVLVILSELIEVIIMKYNIGQNQNRRPTE